MIVPLIVYFAISIKFVTILYRYFMSSLEFWRNRWFNRCVSTATTVNFLTVLSTKSCDQYLTKQGKQQRFNSLWSISKYTSVNLDKFEKYNIIPSLWFVHSLFRKSVTQDRNKRSYIFWFGNIYNTTKIKQITIS